MTGWSSGVRLDRNRFRGALLGLAVGDALGTTVEFKAPGTFAPVTDIAGGGPFNLPRGAWTDDTSMALCLADSLLAVEGFDPADQLRRYVGWYRRGERSSTGRCFDIGGATSSALERFEQTGEPFPGDASPNAGGNGTLMRLAPLPMAYAMHPQAALTLAADSARTTHGLPAAIDATRYLTALLLDALQGAHRDALLDIDSDGHAGALRASGTLHPEVQEVADGSFARRNPPEIRGDGYAVRALEAALWALHTTFDFGEGALAAVNLGDDADTTGAIYGQLAGAVYGIDGIPAGWREVVLMGEEIIALADDLHDLAGRIDPDRRADAEPARAAATAQPAPRPAVLSPEVPDAYWVEQGAIAAGLYPGAADKEEARAKLTALLHAGITTFVDLTEERDRFQELEPYSHLLRRTAESLGKKSTHLRLPIDDTDVPPPWRMRVILDAIETAAAAGEVVYVHCWGGVGRTGTVVGCLLRERGVPAGEVLRTLQALRAHTPRGRTRRSPENDRQKDFVTGWEPRPRP
ncbi:MAG: ADP-ribosylglycohydrolase family protein [Miltoncostaeaceae bacterium]